MHSSNLLVLIASFLTLTIASPSPVRLVPRSCSTVVPSYLQMISEIDPATTGPNQLASFFLWQEYEPGTGLFNQVYQVAQFDLPPAAFATGAEPLLVYCFPENYDIFYTIGLSQPPIIQAYPLALTGTGNEIIQPDYWNWDNIIGDDLYDTPGSETFSLNPGECGLIQGISIDNHNITPVDGIIGFVFKMVWPTTQSALNAATFGSGAGIFVIYNCVPPF